MFNNIAEISESEFSVLIMTYEGVPKLKRAELETACEDFSNIIGSTSSDATIYKGTLSTGSEIAVLAVASGSLQDWSVDHETQFQEKVTSEPRSALLVSFTASLKHIQSCNADTEVISSEPQELPQCNRILP